MLHGVYFPPSVEGEDETGRIRARYMNRYVRSDSFQKANKHGNVMLSVGLMMNGGRGLIKILKQAVVSIFRSVVFRVTNIGNGNTGLAFIGHRLLALHEAGVPIETAVPSLATIGEFYFEKEGQKRGKSLLPNQEACTAHPKVRATLTATSLAAFMVLELVFPPLHLTNTFPCFIFSNHFRYHRLLTA